MGGNLTVNGYTAIPIDVNRENAEMLMDFYLVVADAFLTKYQWPLTIDPPFTGTTPHFFNSTEQLSKVRPTIGDIDIQVFESNRLWLMDMLQDGAKYGKFTVYGSKGHGTELSVLIGLNMRQVYQVDFQFVDVPGSDKQRFLHSSSWEDLERRFKGAYHKILLNAIGLDTYKFSISHGLRRRDTGEEIPFEQYADTLFPNADPAVNIHSFVGLVDAVSRIEDKKHRFSIYHKFCTHLENTLKNDTAENKYYAESYFYNHAIKES